jgi:aquaporin NIP
MLLNMNYRKYIAEIAGTFILVFCGTGAIIVNQESGGAITHLGVSMTFGLVVTAMIFALGDVSGAHMNPAVTMAFALDRQLAAREVLPYILAQGAGAFCASGALSLMFPANKFLGTPVPAGSECQSFILEAILSLILILVIFNVSTGAKEKGTTAAIAIGSTVAMAALFGGPVSGAAINPIRSMAPAVVSGHTEHLWLYVTAPLAGAVLAVLLHRLLYDKKQKAV